MAVEWPEIVIAGATFASVVGGIFAWHFNRLEDLRKILSDHIGEDIKTHNDLHERINKVRDEYVRREDFHMDIDRLENGMKGVHISIADLGDKLTARIDKILEAILHPYSRQAGE